MTSPTEAVYIKPEIPFGFCHCGCGEKTRICPKSDPRDGSIKGRPYRYIRCHALRSSPLEYLEEDRGYKTPCWTWQRGTDGKGYGKTNVDGVRTQAHRAFYERRFGTIPSGLDLDHLCRIRRCVNPDHMEPVPRQINVQRGAQVKLSPEALQRLLQLSTDGLSSRKVAPLVGVSPSQVTRILRGVQWANVTGRG